MNRDELEAKAKQLGLVIEDEAKAFYVKAPFWAGFTVGAIMVYILKMIFRF